MAQLEGRGTEMKRDDSRIYEFLFLISGICEIRGCFFFRLSGRALHLKTSAGSEESPDDRNRGGHPKISRDDEQAFDQIVRVGDQSL
jgi:hypothetical protein